MLRQRKLVTRARLAGIGVMITGVLAAVWANRGASAALPLSATADSLVVEKVAHRMTLYLGNGASKTYRVALGRGGLADKEREGDLRVPEGHYSIDSRLEQSAFHLALHVSYPDSSDRARATRSGVAPGHSIMVHGIRSGLGWLGRFHRYSDWTAGCVAVTNSEIEELWRVVPNGTPITLRP